MIETVKNPRGDVEVAVVGKYIELHDAYKSIYEALTHGGIANHLRVKFRKVAAEDVTPATVDKLLEGVHGVLVPGGFGERGIPGMIETVKYARTRSIPYFGICLGLQCAAIEIARNVLGLGGADSTEFVPDTPHPVISLLEEQEGVTDKGGTMRLGAYPCHLAKGSVARQAYGADEVSERHRHRFEFNNAYRDRFEKGGVVLSGIYPDKNLVEILELKNHPWFVGVQFHPEFQSKPVAAHPLFASFIEASGRLAGHGKSGAKPKGVKILA
jgi:CTP synthase